MNYSINTRHANSHGHLHPLDPHVLPALNDDPALTTHGAVYPTLTARPAVDGLNVELFDPSTGHRMAVNLDITAVHALHLLLTDCLATT